MEKIKDDIDYVLICGSDDILPLDYSKRIISLMEQNENLVIASGKVIGEKRGNQPIGVRIVKTSFWKKLNGLKYPVKYGWEDWLYFKAWELGFEAKSFEDIKHKALRSPDQTKMFRSCKELGKAMRSLGYYFPYALGRCLKYFFKNQLSGIKMFYGYISSWRIEKLDVASYVKEYHKSKIKDYFLNIFKKYKKKMGI